METVFRLFSLISSFNVLLITVLKVILSHLLKLQRLAQMLFSHSHNLFSDHYSRRSTISSMFFKNCSPLRWEDVSFQDSEKGFPTLQVRLYNSGNDTVLLERAKFHIDVVGRLSNKVGEHFPLPIEHWGYNIQFDPVFEGRCVNANLSTTILPRSKKVLSFTIGQEFNNVGTLTMYYFYLDLTDSKNRTIVSNPITLGIPSPIKRKNMFPVRRMIKCN